MAPLATIVVLGIGIGGGELMHQRREQRREREREQAAADFIGTPSQLELYTLGEGLTFAVSDTSTSNGDVIINGTLTINGKTIGP